MHVKTEKSFRYLKFNLYLFLCICKKWFVISCLYLVLTSETVLHSSQGKSQDSATENLQ